MALPSFSAFVLQDSTNTVAGVWGLQAENPIVWNPLPTNGFRVAGTGDFNSDAIPDLVLQNSSNTTAGIWLMDVNPMTFTYEPTTWVPLPDTAGFKIAGVGNFQSSAIPASDGIPDLVLQDASNTTAGIWLMGDTPGGLAPISWDPLPSTAGLRIAGAGNFFTPFSADIVLQDPTNQFGGVWQIGETPADGLTPVAWDPLPSTAGLIATVNNAYPDSFVGPSNIVLQDPSNTLAGVWDLGMGGGTQPIAWDPLPSTNGLTIGPSLFANSLILPPSVPV